MAKTYFIPHGGYCSGTALEDVANVLTAKHAGDNAMVEMKACNCDGNGIGDVSPTLSSDHNNRVTDLTQIVYPLNSMVIGKDVKVRDRQTTGIGEANDPLPTIGACHHHAVAIAENTIGRKPENGGNGVGAKEDVAYTQEATAPQGVCFRGLVRRLTPLECERLMGFPDNWTLVPFRGKMASDTPRYKACGNSMMVNVMRWIGLGIEAVEQRQNQEAGNERKG